MGHILRYLSTQRGFDVNGVQERGKKVSCGGEVGILAVGIGLQYLRTRSDYLFRGEMQEGLDSNGGRGRPRLMASDGNHRKQPSSPGRHTPLVEEAVIVHRSASVTLRVRLLVSVTSTRCPGLRTWLPTALIVAIHSGLRERNLCRT